MSRVRELVHRTSLQSGGTDIVRLQAAVDAASTHARIKTALVDENLIPTTHVTIPGSTYNGVTLQGLGRNVTTLKADPSFTGVNQMVYITGLSTTSISNVSVKDLTLDGDRISVAALFNGLYFAHSSSSSITGVTVRRVEAKNFRKSGFNFEMDGDVYDCVSTDNSNSGGSHGFVVQTSNGGSSTVQMHDIVATRNDGLGLDVSGTLATCTVTGFTFDANGGGCKIGMIANGDVTSLILINGTLDDNTTSAGYALSHPSLTDFTGIIVTMTDVTANDNAGGGMVFGTYDQTLIRVTCNNNTGHGVQGTTSATVTASYTDLTCEGNTIDGVRAWVGIFTRLTLKNNLAFQFYTSPGGTETIEFADLIVESSVGNADAARIFDMAWVVANSTWTISGTVTNRIGLFASSTVTVSGAPADWVENTNYTLAGGSTFVDNS